MAVLTVALVAILICSPLYSASLHTKKYCSSVLSKVLIFRNRDITKPVTLTPKVLGTEAVGVVILNLLEAFIYHPRLAKTIQSCHLKRVRSIQLSPQTR